jgi:hypothetical protein
VFVVDDGDTKEAMNQGSSRSAQMIRGVDPGRFGFPSVEEGAEAEGEVAQFLQEATFWGRAKEDADEGVEGEMERSLRAGFKAKEIDVPTAVGEDSATMLQGWVGAGVGELKVEDGGFVFQMDEIGWGGINRGGRCGDLPTIERAAEVVPSLRE